MSAFQDQMAADLDVFFNLNEFGEPHNINGKDGVVCILEKEDIGTLRPGLGRFEGTSKDLLLLMIKQSDWIWGEPVYNQNLTVDKVRYRLKKIDLVGGSYELLLGAVD